VHDRRMDNNTGVDKCNKGFNKISRPLHQEAKGFDDNRDIQQTRLTELTGVGYSVFSSFLGRPNLLYPPSFSFCWQPVNKNLVMKIANHIIHAHAHHILQKSTFFQNRFHKRYLFLTF
jgi:hypothetical protein